ncbi:MAG TPA: hypothetical protein VES02_01745 [Dermatophilaceae bacterium]|nr:hypothetical protein [Dermatophilaceae bacterium]
MSQSTASASGRVPVPVRVAAYLLVLVALVAAALGVLEAMNTRWQRAIVGVGGALLLGGYALWLLVIARGLLRLRSWSRGMAVATQVVLLPVAWSFWGGSTKWVAALLALIPLVVIGCLLSPPATRVLVPESLRRKGT